MKSRRVACLVQCAVVTLVFAHQTDVAELVLIEVGKD